MRNIQLFSDFELFLAQRLEGVLPGREAHARMAGAHYKGWPQPGERTRASAVLILFYPSTNKTSGEPEIRFPVIMRPVYDGVHSGQVAFPGGKADPDDADLNQTALREAWEEIKAPRQDVRVVGHLSELYIAASDMRVVPVIGTLPFEPTFYPDSREVSDIRTILLSDMVNEPVVKDGKFPVRGGYVKAPYYDYQGLEIWGATAMMISELLEVIGQ